jgi:hypothetical protein
MGSSLIHALQKAERQGEQKVLRERVTELREALEKIIDAEFRLTVAHESNHPSKSAKRRAIARAINAKILAMENAKEVLAKRKVG